MKVLFQDYTFNASAKTVTFNVTETVTLNRILLITNVSTNAIIYNFANPLQGGVIANNVLTLDFDTTSMSNSDSLQIFLDLYGSPSTETTSVSTNESIKLLRRLVKIAEPLAVQDSSQRQKVVVEGISGTTTIGNVSTLSNVDARFQFVDAARTAYATGIRAKIINT